ncbi:MAG: transposase [Candidatus Yonathbacteria bacterium]|nr:transposase [Candidatus Yonathbacteria bacterium]
MSKRKIAFVEGEYYHIYNRGVDKRNIFSNEDDVDRFLRSMIEFNALEPIGSIFENSFNGQLGGKASKLREEGKLVEFVTYCLNANHYHFLLMQTADRGIEKFMHRLSTGYTGYFNEKEKRSGSLFQGKFKAVHVDSNEYLLHISAYVNLNDRVHQLGGLASKLVESRSSWGEYTEKSKTAEGICDKGIILGQFRNNAEYKKFALSSLDDILTRREDPEEI